MKNCIFLVLIALFSEIGAAKAEAPKVLGEYGDWTAYYYRDNSGPVCYMASAPKKDEGKYTSRGDIYVVVTHRPNEKSYDVITVNAGYTYKQASAVKIKIGAQTFGEDDLFTNGGKAWAVSADTDKKIVNAMKRGIRMIIVGTSSKGTLTKDTYSLDGFSSAYKAISNKCK